MKKKLIKLFLSTFYLSAFTFGGGYVIVTLMKKKFVDELHWIDENEMLDLVAIAQSSPGAIAVNGSIVLGYKICGIPGVIVSVIGTILPPFIIISIVSFFYDLFAANPIIQALLEGMQAGVGAVIVSVVFDMMQGMLALKDPISIVIMVAAFIANYCFNMNVVYIVLLCALYGVLRTIYKTRRKAV